jgi:hypothetical protein
LESEKLQPSAPRERKFGEGSQLQVFAEEEGVGWFGQSEMHDRAVSGARVE